MNSLRRRCGWLLLPIVANRNISTKASPSVSAKIQWRAYFSFGSNPTRHTIRESKISCPSTRHRFSSSSSSKSGIGFVGWYMRKLDTHPFITKSITSSLIYAAADLTSQVEDGFYISLQFTSALFHKCFPIHGTVRKLHAFHE